jgi:hypothetical protein
MRTAIRQILLSNNPQPSFFAPLETDLLLRRGVGLPTYTRASTATVTDFEGLLKTAKSGEARFEGARRVENLVTLSEDFTSAGWVKNGTASVSANTTIAPNGTQTASTLSGATDNTYSSNNLARPVNCIASNTYRLSIYVKSAGATTVKISLRDNGTGVIALSSAISLDGNWKRITLSAQVGGATPSYYLTVGSANGDVYIWGAQAENVTGQANQAPSEYVSVGVLSAPYHGANVDGVKYFDYLNGNTVVDNVVTEAQGAAIPDATLKGYLAEGARTNLLLQSVTPATQNVTVTEQAYTISMWGTGSCTLSGTGSGVLTGTGANDRVQLTVTPTTGTLTLTFAGTNTNGQLETGSFASSYIPTTTAAVTRSADALSYSAINNINPLAISKYVEFSVLTANATFIMNINDGTENNRDSFYPGFNTGYPTFNVLSGGIAQASITVASPYNNGVMHKIASSAENNKFLFFGDGNQIGSTDTAGVMPMNLTTINIGKSSVVGSQLFGTIRKVKIWKKALKDSKLVEMTR